MTKKIRWGVLGCAKIAIQKVIPGMQKGKSLEIVGIASRSLEKAKKTAKELKIEKAYGTYEELLKDPSIEAIYIPLPNHLHVLWSIKALEANKHVLCEKPIALSAREAETLLQVSKKHPHLHVMEAFMYRFHPQWVTVQKAVNSKTLGKLKTIQSFFSYSLKDPDNVRNNPDFGGGGLLDIGCYCISLARFLFSKEPQKIFGTLEMDPRYNVDRFASGILDFGQGISTFSCATQIVPFQRVQIVGTEGSIEMDLPFTPSPDLSCSLQFQKNGEAEKMILEPCDQYTLQGEAFSKAILKGEKTPTPLEDAIFNMKGIDALRESAKAKTWVSLT